MAGQIAAVDLPTDRRYHAVKISFEAGGALAKRAVMEEKIKLIRVLLDGRAQWELTAKELFAILDLNGYPIQDGIIPLCFSEPWRESTSGQDQTAWSLKGTGITDFNIELTLADDVKSPRLEAYADYDRMAVGGATGRPDLGFIRKIIRRQIPVSATGIHTEPDVPAIGNLQALYCFEGAKGDIARIKLDRDGETIVDIPRHINDEPLKAYGATVPDQVFALRMDKEQRQSLNLGNQVLTNGVPRRVPTQFEFTMTKATPFYAVYSYVGGRN